MDHEEGAERWAQPLEGLDSGDVARVGGKNASRGEMIGALAARGIRVPPGFATTADAYRRFLEHNALEEEIAEQMDVLADDDSSLSKVGAAIRERFEAGEFPEEVAVAIRRAYRDLAARCGRGELDVAVRKSATAEDLPEASFERVALVLGDEEILRLARWGSIIEEHYGTPMDVEGARDGRSGDCFGVQARPETVQSQKEKGVLRRYHLGEKGERLVSGLAIGEAVAAGPVCVIRDPADIDRFVRDGVLVTGMTDPDWVRRALRRAAPRRDPRHPRVTRPLPESAFDPSLAHAGRLLEFGAWRETR